MKTICVIISSLGIFITSPAPARADPTPQPSGTEPPSHFEVPPLVPQVESDLMSAVFDDKLFSAPPSTEPPPDERMAGFWKSNRPACEAKLKEIVLTLVHADAADPQKVQGDDQKLVVKLKYDQDMVTVLSDHPKYKKYAGGLRFPLGAEHNWKQVLEGSADTSVAILVPRVKSAGFSGIFICPYASQLPSKKDKDRDQKQDSPARPYVLQSAAYVPLAYGQASVQSGFGSGSARAIIQTSPNLPPALIHHDEQLSRDPSISVEYRPDASATLDQSQQSGASSSAGIRIVFELQNSAGYRRTSRYSDVAWIRSVRVNSAYTAKSGTGSMNIEKGDCVMVIRNQSVEHVYSREEVTAAQTPQ